MFFLRSDSVPLEPDMAGRVLDRSPQARRSVRAAWAFRLPGRWRSRWRTVRRDEIILIFLATVLGALVGSGVVGLRILLSAFQQVSFGVAIESLAGPHLVIPEWRLATVPVIGGLAFGLGTLLLRRWHRHDIVDAIEANALHGGRMSLGDSLLLAVLTVVSVGVGASVGLEAAVTQIGAGLCSWVGQRLDLRRSALRTLVGCGAAAAIAAAFNAPLAGAFYALELVISGYAVAALAPVLAAAVTGALVARAEFGTLPVFAVFERTPVGGVDYALCAVLGVVAAALGVAVMGGATVIEATFARYSVPRWLRPALGGLAIGGMALAYPQVLGSGHSAVDDTVQGYFPLGMMVALIAVKALGSLLSVGSGFRGGLFSASLFLGSLLGAAFSMAVGALPLGASAGLSAYAVVGMAAVAASVVGAPVTMIMLALEGTSDYPVSIGVLIGVVVASVATRRWFGYSFATWRFHLRGINLNSAYDIGRLRELRVVEVLDRKLVRVPAETDLDTLISLFLLGPAEVVFVEDADDRCLGVIDAAAAHAARLEDRGTPILARDLAREPPAWLTRTDRLVTALDLLEQVQDEVIPVVAAVDSRRVIGCIREAEALRRYFRELEAMRAEDLGERNLLPRLQRRRQRRNGTTGSAH